MKRLLLTLVCMGFAGPALACSCAPMHRDAIIGASDVVFTGTVTKIERTDQGVVATFDVSDVKKGTVDESVEVRSNANSAACGVDFKQGQTTEVAANQTAEGVLRTNLCQMLGLKR